jgi:hypothetical protein
MLNDIYTPTRMMATPESAIEVMTVRNCSERRHCLATRAGNPAQSACARRAQNEFMRGLDDTSGAIAYAAHRRNDRWIVRVVFHLATQTLHVNIYQAGVRLVLIAPDLF